MDTSGIAAEFGRRVRARREQLTLTFEEVAQRTRVLCGSSQFNAIGDFFVYKPDRIKQIEDGQLFGIGPVDTMCMVLGMQAKEFYGSLTPARP